MRRPSRKNCVNSRKRTESSVANSAVYVTVEQGFLFAQVGWRGKYMNNHVHSALQEHIEKKLAEHRKNTQNIHNITIIHKPHGLEK